MPREVSDAEGVVWSCVQAFAGLGGSAAETEAAHVGAAPGCVHVVCTPSGGARSVRVELPEDWEAACPDDAILGAIRAGS